jgi:hypothetical protein
MDQATVEVGKSYHVSSNRKGKFNIKVTSINDEWVTGIITNGKAKAILEYNEVYEGEEVTLRRSLTYFTEC